jgi:acyl-CoA synthetase (AMP-forming)/AMP-acid ligase II
MFFVSTCFSERPVWRCLGVSGSATEFGAEALRHRTAAGAQLLQSIATSISARVAIILDPEAELVLALVALERAQLEYAVFDPELEPAELGDLLADFAPDALIAVPERVVALRTWLGERQTTLPRLRVFTLRQVNDFGPCWEAAVDACHFDDAWTDGWQGPSRALTYSAGSTRIPVPVCRADPLTGDGLAARPVTCATDSHYLLSGTCAHWGTVARLLYCLRHGIEVTMLGGFDAEVALAALSRLNITHSVWVPQMLAALAALPTAMQAAYVGKAHREAWVVGAYCPAELQQLMMQWWGPILHVHYGGIETQRTVTACSAELLERSGSVGHAAGLSVRDSNGVQLATGQLGRVWLEDNCTAGATELTLDDLGYVDAAGYLFLVDRCCNGKVVDRVLIHPGEAERVLATHPAVADVAVVWAEPDAASTAGAGTYLLAMIVPRPGVEADPLLEVALIDYVRARLSLIKCPKQARFIISLPPQAGGRQVATQDTSVLSR